MLVKHWMSKGVISVDADDSMQSAISLMKEHKIRMLPVMQRGSLVGVVSSTDLKRASASDATMLDVHEMLYLISKIRIKNIMTKNPITVHPDSTVEETAQLLMDKKISGAPVVDDANKVVGVITKDDLFRVLISLSGLGKKGMQMAFLIEDRPGSIKELTDVIRKYEGRIASILTTYERAPVGHRMVYLRMYDVAWGKMPALLAELKESKSEMIYLVDHRENRREIYRELE